MDLSVIIVNYNVKYFLEQCLYSVIKAAKNTTTEIFVVDNHSTDGSREYLELKFPDIIFRWNRENTGFAKANNSVLKEVKGDYILFLNPDTILPEDCFEKCIAFLRLRENCGALGVRMIDGSGNFLKESKRSFPSAAAAFFKMTGMAAIFPGSQLFSRYYAGHLPEHKVNVVDVLAGAFFMAPKKVIDAVAGFDEDFFMYGEDIDLAYRIRNEGYKNYYFPDITIVHFKGESTQKQSKLYIQRFYGAMQLFVKKHYKRRVNAKYFMGLAISLSKTVAIIKLLFVSAFSGRKKSTSAGKETMVIAGQGYFNEMIQLIKYAEDPLIIQGRITLDNSDKDPAAGNIDTIESIISKNKTSKIIFCEGPLEFKKMIEMMQQLKKKTGFLFHAKQSDSIVGSDDKNANGIFIAK
ncbi:MAG: glycosyltransferase family 2 protein [Ferruginibacter sp.]